MKERSERHEITSSCKSAISFLKEAVEQIENKHDGWKIGKTVKITKAVQIIRQLGENCRIHDGQTSDGMIDRLIRADQKPNASTIGDIITALNRIIEYQDSHPEPDKQEGELI
jgi:hypothetical protein